MFWAWGTDCINGVVSWDLSLRSSLLRLSSTSTPGSEGLCTRVKYQEMVRCVFLNRRRRRRVCLVEAVRGKEGVEEV